MPDRACPALDTGSGMTGCGYLVAGLITGMESKPPPVKRVTLFFPHSRKNKEQQVSVV